MNRLNQTESAVFQYHKFFLFLKDPFFPDYLLSISPVGCAQLVKILITLEPHGIF